MANSVVIFADNYIFDLYNIAHSITARTGSRSETPIGEERSMSDAIHTITFDAEQIK